MRHAPLLCVAASLVVGLLLPAPVLPVSVPAAPGSLAAAAPLEGVVAVAGGLDTTYALTRGRGILVWGDTGLISASSGGMSRAAVEMPGLAEGIAAIAAAGQNACVLTEAGGAKCWGANNYGQLGTGTLEASSAEPVEVVGLAGRAVAIAAGERHACAVLKSGGVKCWGDNTWGQLGNGSTTDSLVPAAVLGVDDARTVTAGSRFTCALTRAGGVKCWGSPRYVGAGLAWTFPTTGVAPAAQRAAQAEVTASPDQGAATGDQAVTSAVDVLGLAGGAQAVSAGAFHVCALTIGGGVKCWGDWDEGGLGVSEAYVAADTPTEVVGLSSGVIAVSAGGQHTCAIFERGAVRCWGKNQYGEVGAGISGVPQLLPAGVVGLSGPVFALATGDAHSCAALQDGVFCWGSNRHGQLGDGTTTDRPTPVRVLLAGVAPRTTTVGTPVPETGVPGRGVPTPAALVLSPGAFRPRVGPLVPQITTYIPTPLDVSTDPVVVGTNLGLAALMMLLLAVADKLWARILDEREGALRARLRPAREALVSMEKALGAIVGAHVGGQAAVSDVIRLVAIAVSYGAAFSLLDRTWSPLSAAGITLFLSMVIAHGLVGIGDDLLQWRTIRRWGKRADLSVRPTNLLMAVLSIATTRGLGLVPGLMFGSPGALQADEEALNTRQRGILTRIAALAPIGFGLTAWLPTWGIALLQGHALPAWLDGVLGGVEALLLVIFAMAVQSTWVNLLGLPGGFGPALRKKSRVVWVVALLLATFVFLHTLLNPRGSLAQALKEGNIQLFFGVAGAYVFMVSGAWLIVRLRRRRAA